MSLTGTGQLLGTIDYISPEQAQDTKAADIRSDIYSLGCSLFYLLTRRPVFRGENVMERLMARALEEAPHVSESRNDVPTEVGDVIAKMLRRDTMQKR